MRVCSSCGATYPDSVNVCGHDGTRLRAAAEAVATVSPAVALGSARWGAAAELDIAGERVTIPRFVVLPRHAEAKRAETSPGPPPRLRARATTKRRRADTSPAAPSALRADTSPVPELEHDAEPEPEEVVVP